jgi:rhodanese-related sulfurtransferase
MQTVREIDAETLEQWLAEGREFELVDVRTPEEMVRGVIQGAHLRPLHTLPEAGADLGTRMPAVFYCQSGGRSAQACLFLMSRGEVDTYNLQGGVEAWCRSGRQLAAPPEGAL